MKKLRIFAALFVAFGPLFFATPAQATTLEEAQAALAAGQQEVLSATASRDAADVALIEAQAPLAAAQEAYNAAHAAKLATAVVTPAVTTSASQNVVVNGTFEDASAWSNIGMGSAATVTNSNIARVYDGVLIGSYVYSFISQTGTFATPTRSVTFSYDMSNNNFNDGNRPQVDGYRVEFRTYNAAGQRLNYYNTGDRADSFAWRNFTATYTLTDDAVRWDIGFRMVDNGYWNGNFAGSIDNVRLVAEVTTVIPETTTYGEAETAAETSAQTTLTLAQLNFNSAVSANHTAQARLNAALAAIPGLEAAVASFTPAPAPEPTPTTTVEAPWWAQQNYEGDTVTITAPDGWMFYSARAWYGSPTDPTCGADVSSILEPLMVGQHSVTVALDNGTFGDPCGGVVKVTRFTWSIVPQTNTVEPTPTATPQNPEPSAESSPTPAPESTPTPSTSPEPLPSQSPSDPAPEPAVPVVPPVVTPPVVEPVPQPQPIPFPVEEPPVAIPDPEPTPEPVVTPQPEPVPTPSETETPVPVVSPPVVEPTPEPVVEPAPEPPVVEPEVPALSEKPTVTETVAVMDELTTIEPENLTDAQVELLVEAAEATFLIAEQGSPAYEQALEALAVAANADDEELPAELAAIPLLGDVAGAALEVFNDLGNIGADMAPAEREKAEKVVVSAIIVTQVVTSAAVSAAVASAAAPTSSSRRIK